MADASGNSDVSNTESGRFRGLKAVAGAGGDGNAAYYTHPEPDHKLLLEQLKLTLPTQPPPRISSRGKLLNQE
jgi:hypothetical protein